MQKLFLAPISMNMYRYNLWFPLSKKCNIIRVGGGERGGRTSYARWIMHDIFINRFQVWPCNCLSPIFQNECIIQYDFLNWSSQNGLTFVVNWFVWFHLNGNTHHFFGSWKDDDHIATKQVHPSKIKMTFFFRALTDMKRATGSMGWPLSIEVNILFFPVKNGI